MRRQSLASEMNDFQIINLPSQKLFSAPNSSYGIFHLHVSKCVDKRVEHGDNNCVEERKHFIFWVCGRSNVNKDDRCEKEDHGL